MPFASGGTPPSAQFTTHALPRERGHARELAGRSDPWDTLRAVDTGTIVLLAGAGFVAGAVNAVAGGGSLVSFPALLAAGYPSVTANVTNAVAVLPGYVGGSLAYRSELAGQAGRVRALAATSALGAAAGAALLLSSPASLFEAIVPWLILAACGLLALQPRAAIVAERHRHRHRRGSRVVLHTALFLAAVYGGYFGAGLGIVLLAVLGVLMPDDLHRLNALKGVLSLIVAIVAAVGFAVFGPIAWDAALIVGAASLVGGAAGVRVARRLPAPLLRGLVIVLGVAVAIGRSTVIRDACLWHVTGRRRASGTDRAPGKPAELADGSASDSSPRPRRCRRWPIARSP
jgi:hypothetical protein